MGHVKPHDLRRTLATELLETGAPVHDVQAQMGHANAQTTLQNYTGKVDAQARRRSGAVYIVYNVNAVWQEFRLDYSVC